MHQLFNSLGLVGAVLVAGAYIPQITHLIVKHCAYGISIKAWCCWLIAAILIFPHALLMKSIVFIALQLINIIAIAFVLVYSYFHQGNVCFDHQHKIL